ncbi:MULTISPECIES: NVEALA domain-containing protein [unclassified Proteiniphilum]|jgi:hypothetical protein|uniref:NVEALA domain-containing protein n=1 Tax=unclassified Proteiniphilum TaxID=2622718 RepID=UPI002579B5ED|nr:MULTISPECIES: NVEALA domain-containing protein [unclassified Proteiniphilum]MDD3968181.1 NVEALA domain-containing protein [Proteiniphilum sp.]MDD4800398.1 NVEALA domain-containing protein [Proteiniphilum sp.]
MSKKTVLSSIFAIALVTVAGMGINKSVNKDTALSNLALSNVEALATPEQPLQIPCEMEDKSKCKVLCQDASGTLMHIEFHDMRPS